MFAGGESLLTSVSNILILGVVSWLIYNEKKKRFQVSKKEVNAVKGYINFKKSIENNVNRLIKETEEIRKSIEQLENKVVKNEDDSENDDNNDIVVENSHKLEKINNLLNLHSQELQKIKDNFNNSDNVETWLIPDVIKTTKSNSFLSLSDSSDNSGLEINQEDLYDENEQNHEPMFTPYE